MELFLLIAIGITVISFISIALTKPSPVTELIPELEEPVQAGFITDDAIQPGVLTPDQKSIASSTEELLVKEEIMATMA